MVKSFRSKISATDATVCSAVKMTRSFHREEQSSFLREVSFNPSPVGLFSRSELSSYEEPRSEGYDEYFDPPLESKYECPICLLGLREPVQTSCGHRFCKGCILRSIRDAGPKCPVDNERLNESQLYPDNFAKREMLSHEVFCRLKKQHGCPWKGPLNKLMDHLKDCSFVDINCPKECGKKPKRKDLKQHLEQECPNRTAPCNFCKEGVKWNELENHYQGCPKYPQACEKCEKENIPRDMMENHLDKECPNTEIKCPFNIVGCSYKGLRAAVTKHVHEKLSSHMMDMSKAIADLVPVQGPETQTQRNPPRRTRGGMEARPQEQVTQDVYMGDLSAQTRQQRGEIDLRHNFLSNTIQHLERRLEEARKRQERPIQELTLRNLQRRTWHGMEARPQEQAAQNVYMGELSTQSYQQCGKINDLQRMIVQDMERGQGEARMRQERPIQELTLRNPQRCTRYGMEACPQEQAAQDVYNGELSAQPYQQRGEIDDLQPMTVQHLERRPEEARMRQERPIQELTLRNPQRCTWGDMEARPQEQAAQGVYMGKWSAQEAHMRQERPIQKLKMRDGGPKCPVDNERLNESQLYPDSFAKQEMLSYEGLCWLKKQHGCPWKGPLNKLEIPPKKTTKEIQEEEEEELQLAIALSLSLEEAAKEGVRAAVTNHVNEQLSSHMMDMSEAIADLAPAQGTETQTQRNPPRRTLGGMEARPQEQAAQDVYMGELSAQTRQHRGEIDDLRHMVTTLSNTVQHLERRLEEARMRQNPQRRTRGSMEARPQEQATQDVYMGELSTQTYQQRREIDDLRHMITTLFNTVQHLERWQEEARMKEE